MSLKKFKICLSLSNPFCPLVKNKKYENMSLQLSCGDARVLLLGARGKLILGKLCNEYGTSSSLQYFISTVFSSTGINFLFQDRFHLSFNVLKRGL